MTRLMTALRGPIPELPGERLHRARVPRLDSSLVTREERIDGELSVGVFHRTENSYFRFPQAMWTLAQLFDGTRSTEEIAQLYEQRTGSPIAVDDVRTFAAHLEAGNFWHRTLQDRTFAQYRKLHAKPEELRRTRNDFDGITFSALDPDRYLAWLDQRIGRFVYSSWCVCCVLVLFLFEAAVLVQKWHVIRPDLLLLFSFKKITFAGLLRFQLLTLLISLLHESAHGLTCKHYGGQVRKMGFMLIYYMPAAFVDITESWVQPRKLSRIAAIIAGSWIELILCGVAMVVWLNTQPGNWIHGLSYEIVLINSITKVAINLNPLAKLDGYYLLTELIGIPDLKERSTGFLSAWVESRVLRLPVELPAVARVWVPYFVLYAILSGLFGYFLFSLVVRVSYSAFSRILGDFAIVPATVIAFALFRPQLKSLWSVLCRVWQQRVRSPRTSLPLAIVALLLLVVSALPVFRDRERAIFVIEPARSTDLHAVADGVVQAVMVREGERVHSEQPLLTLTSRTVEALHSSAAAQSDSARFQSFDAQMAHRSPGTASADRQAALRSEELSQVTQAQLVLRAPSEGVVLTRDPVALLNQSVGSGQTLLNLALSQSRVARVYVPASALDRLTPTSEVSLLAPGRLRVIHRRLPPLGSAPVKLPPGLIEDQVYQGIALPAFYPVRISLDQVGDDLPFGMQGDAILFGARRSFLQRAFGVAMNLIRAHVW